jgi:hypothetical protein
MFQSMQQNWSFFERAEQKMNAKVGLFLRGVV